MSHDTVGVGNLGPDVSHPGASTLGATQEYESGHSHLKIHSRHLWRIGILMNRCVLSHILYVVFQMRWRVPNNSNFVATPL